MNNQNYLAGDAAKEERILRLANRLIYSSKNFHDKNPEMSINEMVGGILILLSVFIAEPEITEEQTNKNISSCFDTLIHLTDMVKSGVLTFNQIPEYHD